MPNCLIIVSPLVFSSLLKYEIELVNAIINEYHQKIYAYII